MLVSRLPGCEDKIHKLGKTNIICHTHLATKSTFLRRRCSRWLVCYAGRLQANFSHFKKKIKKCFVSAVDKILYGAPPPHFYVFVLFSNRLFSIFHQLVFTKRLASCDSTLRRWRDSLAGFPPRRLDTRQPARTSPAALAHKHW